jgi:hypothetical protein
MEQVLPGLDVEDPFSDPVGQSNDCKDSGDFDGAYKIPSALMRSYPPLLG